MSLIELITNIQNGHKIDEVEVLPLLIELQRSRWALKEALSKIEVGLAGKAHTVLSVYAPKELV